MNGQFNFLEVVAASGGPSQKEINDIGTGDAVKINGQLHEVVDVDKDEDGDVVALFICSNNCVVIVPLSDEDFELESVYYNSTNVTD